MTYQSTQCSSFINQTVGTRNRSKKDKMEETKRNKAAGNADGEDAEAASRQPTASGNSGNYGAANMEVPAVCEESGGRWKVGGPFWGAPIHDQRMVDTILARVDLARAAQAKANKAGDEAVDDATGETVAPAPMAIPTAERLAGMLTSISEELKDVPFYYSLPDLASTLQCTVPTHLEFKSALVNAGYRVSHFHHDPSAFKTDAPNSVVSEI
jgi:tRNA (guanine26-N2/guanine27-N2)-dimethyltransferase